VDYGNFCFRHTLTITPGILHSLQEMTTSS